MIAFFTAVKVQVVAGAAEHPPRIVISNRLHRLAVREVAMHELLALMGTDRCAHFIARIEWWRLALVLVRRTQPLPW